MIDDKKLEALPMHTLSQLRQAVNRVLHRKMRMQAHRGFEATVLDESNRSKEGTRVWVNGTGPVNLTGYMIDAQGNHLRNRKWRIAPEFAHVVAPKPAAKPAPAFGTANDRPTRVAEEAF